MEVRTQTGSWSGWEGERAHYPMPTKEGGPLPGIDYGRAFLLEAAISWGII